jgi:hypothetical protein
MPKWVWTALPIGIGAAIGMTVPGLNHVSVGVVVFAVVALTVMLKDT